MADTREVWVRRADLTSEELHSAPQFVDMNWPEYTGNLVVDTDGQVEVWPTNILRNSDWVLVDIDVEDLDD